MESSIPFLIECSQINPGAKDAVGFGEAMIDVRQKIEKTRHN